MLWQFTVNGTTHRAVYANGRLFTDFPAVEAMAEYFVESETEVECGEVGPHLVASLDALDRAWGTINEAVFMFADVGSVVAPPSLFPEEVMSREGVAEMVKASFASRSEAGRYAAQQRWKGHVKGGDAGENEFASRVRALALEAARLNQLPEQSKDLTLLTPEGHASSGGSLFVFVQLDDGTKVQVPSEQVMRFERDCRAVGEELLKRVEGQATRVTEEDAAAFRKERQRKIFEMHHKIADLEDKFAKIGQKMVEGGFVTTDRNSSRFSEVKALFAEMGIVAETEVEAAALYAAFRARIAYLDEFAVEERRGGISADEQAALDSNMEAIRKIVDFSLVESKDQGYARSKIIGFKDLNSELENVMREKAPPAGVRYLGVLKGEMEKLGIAFGGVPKIDTNTWESKELSHDVSTFIPEKIIGKVNTAGNVSIRKAAAGGGSWDPNTRIIETSGTQSTNLHEYTHAITYSIPLAMGLEQAILARRTFGRTQDALKDKPLSEKLKVGQQKFVTVIKYPNGLTMGAGGKAAQMYAESGLFPSFKVDKFTDPYAGRIYSRNNAMDGGETLTVGMEHLLGEGGGMRNGAPQDRDLMASTLGMLVVLGGMQ